MAKHRAASNEEIIAALMNNRTLAQAAQAAGLSSRALYARMKEQDFTAEYQAARAAVLRETVNQLTTRASAAVNTIAGIMENKEASPATRLQAAQIILSETAKFTARLDKADAAALKARSISAFDYYAV